MRERNGSGMDQAQIEGRTSHALRVGSTEPVRERAGKSGLACTQGSVQQKNITGAHHRAEAPSRRCERMFVEALPLHGRIAWWYPWRPMSTAFWPRGRAAPFLTFASVALLAGCREPTIDRPHLPEPQQALRSDDQRGSIPQESRIADYDLSATLDAKTHRLEGRAVVTWRNRTQRTTSQLPIHLYMNAFRAEDTAWMRSAGGSHRGVKQGRDVPWGYIDVTAVRLRTDQGTQPLPHDELHDPTLMRVDLPQPVGPGGEVTVEFDFLTQLPEVYARTGFAGDFHLAGQWFPKVGVLEEEAGWKAHVFTLHDEFYADFGNYDVTLDVPANMVVGATGIRTGERVEGERRILTYHAEMVHDFAWTASPDFVEVDGAYNGIRIRQLLQPERVEDAPHHFAGQSLALKSFEERYGPYPWSTITIVHPPKDARGAGGMEYPTFYTTSDRLELPPLVREYVFDERLSGVFTTIHEFGHQYFQGLLASDEHAEPWLDEGLNSMADFLAYADAYGEDAWLARIAGHELSLPAGVRSALGRAAPLDPIAQPADAFVPVARTYGGTVYSKVAAGMLTLRNLVGDPLFREALRIYSERWRFRHPTGDDLVATLVEVMGKRPPLAGLGQDPSGEAPTLDLEDYLAQLLHDPSLADFRVKEILNERRPGTAGWHRDDKDALVGGEPPAHLEDSVEDLDDEAVQGTVVVSRPGNFQVPVEVLVEFADGTRERRLWNGRSRYEVFRWPGKRIRLVVLDPKNKLLIEHDRLDNVAYAPRARDRSHGAANILGDLAEAATLVMLGGVGP